MRTILTRIFSVLLAAGTTVSAVAQVQLAKKAVGESATRAAVTQVAKAPSTNRSRIVMPQSRSFSLAKSGLRAVSKGRIPGARKHVYGEATNMPTIAGSVIYADGWSQDYAPIGLYTVPTNDTQSFELIFEGPQAQYGGVAVDGVYYNNIYENYGWFAIAATSAYDMEDGTLLWTNTNIDASCLMYAGCVDPTTNTVYAITPAEEGGQLATIDYSNASADVVPTVTPIGSPLPYSFCAMAATSTGELYGITRDVVTEGESSTVTASHLVKIDKATAAVTVIGETGQLPYYISGAVIDPKTDRMFWTVNPAEETGFITEVNLSTGAATVLYMFPDNAEVAGLYIPAPAAENGAPAAVENLAASFPEGSMSGTISFKAPSTLFDGTAATGAVSYKVLANGVEIAAAETTYGADVTVNYTAEFAGETEFIVTASNAAGASPKAKVKVFIGKGVPETPNVSASYDEATGKVTVTWPAIVSSADGGYLDPAQVKYDVTRYPGEVKVATAIAENSFEEIIPVPDELTQYYYTVVAKYEDKESPVAQSNTITLGSVTPPYQATFDNDLEGWTTFDANADGKTWKWYDGALRVQWNSSLAMDDWLYSVPLKLEGGKMYRISFKAWSNGTSFVERIEAKWGNNATVEAMTNVLLEPTDLTGGSAAPLEAEEMIVPATTGTYYLGFHGISDKDKFYLWLDDVSVSAPTSAEAPATVENLAAVADPNGALKITLSFNAPTKTLAGNDLSSITKISITRDGELVKEIENPAPGAPLSYEDTPAATGTYNYEVVAENAEGVGKAAKISCFCGIDLPEAPAEVSIVEDATPGSVTASWTAVTKDINGLTIPEGGVKYDLYILDGNSRELVASDLTTLSHSFEAVAAGEQDFIQVAVFAKTDNGEGEGQVSDMIPVGTPYDGIDETFAEGTLSYIWGLRGIDGGTVSLLGDSSGIPAANGDNGFIGIKGQYLDTGADFFSGKVSLANLTAPGLTFYTYNIVGDDGSVDINEISVSVRTIDGEYAQVMAPTTVNELCNGVGDAWSKVTVDLSAYAGQVIQFQITGITKQYVYTMIDDIKVGNLLDHDLKAVKMTAPSTVVAGQKYNIELNISNEGAQEAAGWSVDLFANGEKVETIEGTALAASSKTTLQVEREMSPLATESITYTATINYAADLATENNTFEAVIVTPKVSKLPAVSDLAGEQTAAGVKLTWSEPDLTSAPAEPETIDFEDGESFAQEYADWTFVDEDGAPVGGFQGSDIPGITPGTSTASYFVFDSANEAFQGQYAQSFQAHSGSKYLAALFLYDDSQSSDWAISPAAAAGTTVSFYAKSYSGTYPEKIEILTSTGSTDIADFTVLKAAQTVPAEWTLYEFELPENATRFAIHSCGKGSFMLMIDDVTYTPGDKFGDVNIIGYNIYRDGEKINAEPEAECEYVDANAPEGEHAYVVTVVYDKGESAASNEVKITYSSLEDIVAGLSISTEPGKIIVKGAEAVEVTVVATDGKVLYSAKGDAVIDVLPGVYVVKAAEKVVKIAVK